MTQAVLNAHFLRSVADLVNAVAKGDPSEDPLEGKRLSTWAARTGAAMTVPQLVSQAAQFMDPTMRQPDPTSYTEQVKARIPGLRSDLKPRIDVRGNEVPEPRYGALVPGIPWKEPGAGDPLAKQMLRWKKGMGMPKGIEKLPTEEQKAILAHRWQTLSAWGPYVDEVEFARALSSYNGRKEVRAIRKGDYSYLDVELDPPEWMDEDEP